MGGVRAGRRRVTEVYPRCALGAFPSRVEGHDGALVPAERTKVFSLSAPRIASAPALIVPTLAREGGSRAPVGRRVGGRRGEGTLEGRVGRALRVLRSINPRGRGTPLSSACATVAA